MTAGIQVKGSHGVLQIDELYKNLSKTAKGTVSGSSLALSGVTTPVLALRTTDTGGVLIGTISISSGTVTYSFRTGPVSTTYYLFDTPPATALHGFGFQVFTAAGATAFDTSAEYLKIVGQYTLNYPSGGAYTGVTEPTGKTYAFVQIDSGEWNQDIGSGQTYIGAYNVFMDGTLKQFKTVQSAQLTSRSGPSTSGPLVQVRPPIILVLDVTGL